MTQFQFEYGKYIARYRIYDLDLDLNKDISPSKFTIKEC